MDVITFDAFERPKVEADEHDGETDQGGAELQVDAGRGICVDDGDADGGDKYANAGNEGINRLEGHVDAAVRRLVLRVNRFFFFDFSLVMLLVPPRVAFVYGGNDRVIIFGRRIGKRPLEGAGIPDIVADAFALEEGINHHRKIDGDTNAED